MNHLSLFSGIGGLDLAAEWAGFTTVAFVERDPYCQRVLAKRWPGVPIFPDVRDVGHASRGRWDGASAATGGDGGELSGATGGSGSGGVHVVSGGFPCQPHSVAGKRQASADDRDLWPEFARVICEIRPRWVVAENVPGLLHSESGRFFGRVLGDLAEMGYSAGWGVWGAADVGALHLRERVFIVARRDGERELQQGRSESDERGRPGYRGEDVPHADGERLALRVVQPGSEGRTECAHQGKDAALGDWWLTEPDVGRVAHGVPSRVDRLRALGNAVVPQQAFVLFQEIARIEGMNNEFSGGKV